MLRINLLPKEQRRTNMPSGVKKFLKSLVMPTATMIFVFVAAGSVVTVATTSTQVSVSEPVAAAVPAPEASVKALCDQYWGVMVGDGQICEFEQIFHVNLSHAGKEEVLTPIALVPGDTVIVSAVNSPDAVVGGVNYGPKSAMFRASSAGYLAFRASARLSVFTVKEVRVLRCFFLAQDGEIDTTACPNTNNL